MLVGMVKILRDDLDVEGPTVSPRGMGWTSLAWSRDGRNWIRDRAVFLAPDPAPGRWDHAFAWIDEQVVVGDSVYLYYGGYETGHKGDRSSEREIGLVTMPRDRYAGWEAGAEGGVMRSRLLRIRGSRLLLNVDADGGEVLVRARTVDGRDALGACDPISGDLLDAPLRCERELGSLNEPVRLEFEMRNARVFAWTVES
jgi:hypothetical protein